MNPQATLEQRIEAMRLTVLVAGISMESATYYYQACKRQMELLEAEISANKIKPKGIKAIKRRQKHSDGGAPQDTKPTSDAADAKSAATEPSSTTN
ncbi:MAG TPA: hypothetical protein VFC02_09805 [Anaerolineales bacterium]|nr:hypothetical protein [Anaerolineales bacterium]